MKTKIIALLLVVVLAVSVLAGCAYDYQKQDLSPYATVNADTLYERLQNLKIKDGDFTEDETTRAQKVLLKFAQNVVTAIKGDDDRKKTEGTIDAMDFITYCYYCVVTDKNGVNHIVYTENMASGKATDFLLDGNKNFQETLQAALEGFDLAGLYEEKATGDLPASGKMILSYSYSTNKNSTLKTLSNVMLDLSDTENPLVQAILDRNAQKKITLGTKFATGTADNESTTDKDESDPKITVTEGDVETTYTNITVKTVVTGTPVSSYGTDATPLAQTPYLDYTDEKLLEVVLTDMYGESVPVEKTTLFQYFVYPVSCYDIKELDREHAAEAVEELLFAIHKSDLTVNTLEILKSVDYKYTDDSNKTVTLADVIATLVADRAKLKAAETAQTAATKAVTDAQSKLDKLDETATDEEKSKAQQALDEAKEAEAEAKADVEEKKAALDTAAVMAKLAKCVKDEESAIDAIYDAYHKSLYEALESAYNSEILEHLLIEIGSVFAELVTYDANGAVPEKALKEAIKRNMDAYEYEYYEGTDSSNNNKKYTDLYASFKEYLRKKVAADLGGKEVTTDAEVDALIRKESAKQVQEAIAVYVLADALNSKYAEAKLELNKDSAEVYATIQAAYYNQSVDEYYEYLSSILGTYYDPASAYRSAQWYIQVYGETNLRTAYLADLIMAFLTETKKDSEAEDFEVADARDFKNVQYIIDESEDAED